MRTGSIAKRYATALLQVAQEDKKIQAYLEELTRVQQVLADHPQLRNLLGSPVVKSEQKKAIFRDLQGKLSLSPAVTHLLFILVDQDRLGDLPLVILIYRDRADEISGQLRVEVTAAAALGAQREKLQAILEKHFKKKMLMEVKVDPEILGGLIVRMQDNIFDGSLRRELERVKEAIEKQAVA